MVFFLIGRHFIKGAKLQGYAVHSQEELYEIGKTDLKAIETFLGNKKYFFGDNPTVEDATIFSFTTQIVYHDSGPLNEFILGNFNV